MQIWYADTSAVVKLVQPEPETAALRAWLAPRRWVVSDLHRTELRSLDALHLAVARMLGPDLAGVVAYDRRLLDAAAAAGIPTASPA